MRAKERHKRYTLCRFFFFLCSHAIWLTGEKCYFFPDAVQFILIFVSRHRSLTAWVLERRRAYSLPPPAQHNSCNIFNHKSPLSSPFLAPFIPFPPSRRPPLPAITDCFSRHQPPASLPATASLSLFTTSTHLRHSSSPCLFRSSLRPKPSPEKTPHALAAAGEVASLQTRKIHLEQPSAASLPPSELSREEVPHISSSFQRSPAPSWISLLSNYFFSISLLLSYLFLEPLPALSLHDLHV